MGDMKKKISVIMACYNSERTVDIVVRQIVDTLENQDEYSYEIILSNDGSVDHTWEKISNLARKNKNITAINLSQNFGQHSALMSAYREVTGDFIVGLDDDGEHDPREMFKLIDKLEEGYDYVCADYGNHSSQFRTFGTRMNNWMAKVLIGKPDNIDFSSFFVMRRFVVDEIIRYEQPFPYVAGLLLRATKNITSIPMERHERLCGKSGYNLKKMIHLWMNGFTAFSIKPLRAATVLGGLTALAGFVSTIIIIIRKLVSQIGVPGYASTIACILFCSGMIMIMLGVIGEYIGRIYISINNAPQYVIREKVKNKENVNLHNEGV